MKLNIEEIIKALECCIKAETWGDCEDLGCPAHQKQGCYFYLRTDEDEENTIYIEIFKDVLSLIKELAEERKDFEIRALRAENQTSTYKDRYETAVADTVRKMQKRLKALLKTDYINGTREHALSVIDQIAKEMLEG